MQVSINGASQEAEVVLKRENPPSLVENLYVDGAQVQRVTHSRADDVPVILTIGDSDYVIEIERGIFYTIDGMNYDWQPGEQSPSVDSLDAL